VRKSNLKKKEMKNDLFNCSCCVVSFRLSGRCAFKTGKVLNEASEIKTKGV
jgi:hypothetical protein